VETGETGETGSVIVSLPFRFNSRCAKFRSFSRILKLNTLDTVLHRRIYKMATMDIDNRTASEKCNDQLFADLNAPDKPNDVQLTAAEQASAKLLAASAWYYRYWEPGSHDSAVKQMNEIVTGTSAQRLQPLLSQANQLLESSGLKIVQSSQTVWLGAQKEQGRTGDQHYYSSLLITGAADRKCFN
jgi:hypothetical protein